MEGINLGKKETMDVNGAFRGRPPLPPLLPRAQAPLALPSSSTAAAAAAGITVQPKTQNPRDQMDPRRFKRLMAGRQYAQNYRLKRRQHIEELETKVRSLQAELEIYSPKIEYMNNQKYLLLAENVRLKEKLSAISRELKFKEAQTDELKKQVEIGKQIYMLYRQAGYAEFRPAKLNSFHLELNTNDISEVNLAKPAEGIMNNLMEPAGGVVDQNMYYQKQIPDNMINFNNNSHANNYYNNN